MKTLFTLVAVSAAVFLLAHESPTFNAWVDDIRSSEWVNDLGPQLDRALTTESQETIDEWQMSANLETGIAQELAALRIENDTLRSEVAFLREQLAVNDPIASLSDTTPGVAQVELDEITDSVAAKSKRDLRAELRALAERMERRSLGF